jgi:hypothetical protein
VGPILSLRAFQLVSFTGVLLGAAPCVDAQVQKCKDSAGHVTYTQGSCPPGTRPLDASQSAAGNETPGASSSSAVADRPPPPRVPGDGQNSATPHHESCPATLTHEGSDADVRACSSDQSFPSTEEWAQVRQQFKDVGGYRQWTGEYICLRFIAKPNAEGGRTRVRPHLTVSDAMRAGARIPGYQLASVPNQVFPTKVAAVEAGCAAAKGE